MDKRTPQNIILTGFSYTGKSQVGKEVARRLGWAFVDTDDLVVALAGKSIEDIFAQEGEERFREWERQAIKKACIRKDAVIATGGGTIVNAQNRELMAQSGIIVCLEAKPNTILSRLEAEAKRTGNPLIRPLLSGDSPLEHIQYLKASRQPHYALADWTVHTDVLSVEEVSQEVLRGWEQVRRTTAPKDKAYTMVHTATASYPIYVGLGLLDELGKRMAQAGLSGTAVIISDSDVFPLHGSQAQAALQEAGFTIHSITVPSGEDSKNLDNATRIYHRLVELRVERGHAIVALGGGMIGDLAGFAAATLLRGLPLVQAPTSLLAMVDAAIGGKVAVNLPQGKNLVGAFYQPRLVLADVATLNTLPKRELISGWAEVAKHALIADPQLLDLMETNASALASLPPALTAQIIRQSAAIKASVVSA
ncbi:MAG: bifunctional shikimate kinase/3-dehydroquinate synthase, partial [Chloroflexi bacterium]|nr:bifunctional shikimate kinase/3-dehydroquinate synthase [Chloroflexota bacterium]